MAALAVTTVAVAGGASITDSLVAAGAGGDSAPVGPGRFLVVKNADAAPHTVTIATPGTVSGLAIPDATLTVAAGETGAIPLPRLFRGTAGRAAITYDAVTSLSVAVLQLGD